MAVYSHWLWQYIVIGSGSVNVQVFWFISTDRQERNYCEYEQVDGPTMSLSLNNMLPKALDKKEYLMIIEGQCFLYLIETICCDPSSEISHQDGSHEGLQHIFYAELTKVIPNYHQILPPSRALLFCHILFGVQESSCSFHLFCRTSQQGGTAAAGAGLANPLEQPGDQGTGLTTYTAPRAVQGSGESISMGASQTKQDFRYFLPPFVFSLL